MTKRGEACEELADALDALATELPSVSPYTEQQITDARFGIQMIDSQFGPWDHNPSDKERLARVACKFQSKCARTLFDYLTPVRVGHLYLILIT